MLMLPMKWISHHGCRHAWQFSIVYHYMLPQACCLGTRMLACVHLLEHLPGCLHWLLNLLIMQDHTEALKQRVVKLEQMAARNSNDKVISSQVHAYVW